MKRLATILCSLAFMVSGIVLAMTENKNPPGGSYKALYASPTDLPVDVQLDLLRSRVKDTIVIHDTVQVNNIKYVRVSAPESTTDTLYLPMPIPGHTEGTSVNNQMQTGREEEPVDSVGTSKEPIIYLSVDGQVVYESGNVNHSAGEGL